MRKFFIPVVIGTATLLTLTTPSTANARSSDWVARDPVNWCKAMYEKRPDRLKKCYKDVIAELDVIKRHLQKYERKQRNLQTVVSCTNVLADIYTGSKARKYAKTPINRVSKEIMKNQYRKARDWNLPDDAKCFRRYYSYLKSDARYCKRYIDRNNVSLVNERGYYRNMRGDKKRLPSRCR